VVTAFIAVVISFFYVTLSHATPNGGSNGPNGSEFITPMLVVFASLLCGFAVVCYLTHIRLPKMVFILPLILIVVFFISRYVYQYVDSATFYYTNFSSCKIELIDQTGNTSNVDTILFQNSSSGYSTDIQTKTKEKPYPQIIRFADKIIFRNYSTNAKQLFKKEFPFDYSLFKEKKGPTVGCCFWLRSQKTLPMKIVLLSNDKVDLYIDNHLIKQYQLNDNNKK
jgi:predicted membrane metal-binding protein